MQRLPTYSRGHPRPCGSGRPRNLPLVFTGTTPPRTEVTKRLCCCCLQYIFLVVWHAGYRKSCGKIYDVNCRFCSDKSANAVARIGAPTISTSPFSRRADIPAKYNLVAGVHFSWDMTIDAITMNGAIDAAGDGCRASLSPNWATVVFSFVMAGWAVGVSQLTCTDADSIVLLADLVRKSCMSGVEQGRTLLATSCGWESGRRPASDWCTMELTMKKLHPSRLTPGNMVHGRSPRGGTPPSPLMSPTSNSEGTSKTFYDRGNNKEPSK